MSAEHHALFRAASAHHHRADLVRIANQAMHERALLTEFSEAALRQLEGIQAAAVDADPAIRDLRALPWCSIDNDDSQDLDQLTVCQAQDEGQTRLLVAIADVDALVKKGTPIDDHARSNTASVYTRPASFPCCPSACPPT
jgi:exoribonuclease-2